MSKRVITYEAECYICDRATLFTEDLDQQPERLGDSETIWADCTVCGFGVQFYGSNAE